MPPVSLTPDDYLTLNRLATVARLLSGAAHEVNNALQVISGSVELLQGYPDVPEHVSRGLTRIAGQVSRGAEAITGVMAFARMQPDAVGRVDVRELTARAVALRQHAVGRAGLAIQHQVQEGDMVVTGHAGHLLQAVLNLIENAEHALAATRSGQIAVSVARTDDAVLIRVQDDGPGIPPDLRDRVFEPFVSSRPKSDTPGLGLPVAALIAQAHGGSLTLEPTPAGASFLLRLPRTA
jgi:signal transduction histidine kinase